VRALTLSRSPSTTADVFPFNLLSRFAPLAARRRNRSPPRPLSRVLTQRVIAAYNRPPVIYSPLIRERGHRFLFATDLRCRARPYLAPRAVPLIVLHFSDQIAARVAESRSPAFAAFLRSDDRGDPKYVFVNHRIKSGTKPDCNVRNRTPRVNIEKAADRVTILDRRWRRCVRLDSREREKGRVGHDDDSTSRMIGNIEILSHAVRALIN